ncbi:MAG: AmmeMemoRadiSam system protein B [Ilumatobacter sp.]|uniref:AmmeMemoRadiSam system protein B n=1 Tax=Ilumatobacter sp. TaxID=1967498 RepID=UPI002622B603|nr:AmmeMemoRadiSam system protein B [Ilumatobacter sp.]MDJ0769281.1 AmmeMemoRadiSam system protein B [Ilumatobacter sp.]
MTAPTRTRQPAVAGSFYPADVAELDRSIRDAFRGGVPRPPDARVPEAVVVPHAGYVYSGAIAASAYERLVPARAVVRRVVLLGPSHRVFVRGMGVSSADEFETPLGTVAVDAGLRDRALQLPGVAIDDDAHRDEHSLEVQLPFLQTVLDDFALLPLSVGDATIDEVAAVLDALWGGPETVVVISTDLSHYHSYREAVDIDRHTAAAIVARRPDAIADRDACGARPLRGLLQIADRRGLAVEQIDLRNSGDTAGDHRRVVGYGAFAVG